MKKSLFASLMLIFVLSLQQAHAAYTQPPISTGPNAEVVELKRNTVPAQTAVLNIGPVVPVTAPAVTPSISPITPVVVTTSADSPIPPWIAIVFGILGTVWTTIAYPWIQAHVSSLKANAAAQQINMNASLLTQRQTIFENVLAYIAEHSLAIAQTQFPLLAKDILDGKYRDPHFIQLELNRWADQIKTDTISFFEKGGIDLIKVVGTKALDDLIASAASRVSPFPGKDVAVELLDDKVVPMLLNYGIDWVRNYYLGNHSATEVATARELGHLPAEKTYTMAEKTA